MEEERGNTGCFSNKRWPEVFPHPQKQSTTLLEPGPKKVLRMPPPAAPLYTRGLDWWAQSTGLTSNLPHSRGWIQPHNFSTEGSKGGRGVILHTPVFQNTD